MADTRNPFEMPDEMRRFAERSIDQARKAFDDYVGAAQGAFAMLDGSAQSAQKGMAELNRQALAYAEENLQATFDFLGRLARVRSVEEAVEVQQEFFRRRGEAAAAQSEGLSATFATATRGGR